MTAMRARIATLKTLRESLHWTKPGPAHDAITNALRDENAQAIGDSFDLYKRLTVQDAWIWAHPGHTEREDAYLVNLNDYEAIEDAIGETDVARGKDTQRARSWRMRHG